METNNNMFESFLNDILNTLGISSLDSYSIDEKKELIKQVVKNDAVIVDVINKGEIPQGETFFKTLSDKYPDMTNSESKSVDATPKVAEPIEPAGEIVPETTIKPMTEPSGSPLVTDEQIMEEVLSKLVIMSDKGESVDESKLLASLIKKSC
jgi:hypothetical protein